MTPSRFLRHFTPYLLIVLVGLVIGTALSTDAIRNELSGVFGRKEAKQTGYRTTVSFTDPTQFTYDRSVVAFDSRGARLRAANQTSSILLLDSIQVHSDYRLTSFEDQIQSVTPDAVQYQISTDPKVWYYFDGKTWSTTRGDLAKANTAQEISSHLSTLPLVTNRIRFQAILSSASEEPIIQGVTLGIFGVKPALNPYQNSIRGLSANIAEGAKVEESDSFSDDRGPDDKDKEKDEGVNVDDSDPAVRENESPNNRSNEDEGQIHAEEDGSQGNGGTDEEESQSNGSSGGNGNEEKPQGNDGQEDGSQGNESDGDQTNGQGEGGENQDDSSEPPSRGNGNRPTQCEEGDDECDDGSPKITICHRTNAETNPYVVITVNQSGVDGVGANDHTLHIVDALHNRADIIPITDRDGNGVINTLDCVFDPNQHVNLPPVAVDDASTTDQGVSVIIDILTNDSDSDGILVPGTVTMVSPPTNGTVSVDPVTGSVLYTPDTFPIPFVGVDQFSYQVCDNDGACDIAVVTVTVVSPEINNLPPVADNDATITNINTPVTIEVLTNDSDPDGYLVPATVEVTTGPTSGTTAVQPDGSIIYTPDTDFVGTDSFVYVVCDNGDLCDTAVVSIAILNPDSGDRIFICHATASQQNPYVVLQIDPSSLNGGGANDHSQHVGDIIPITDLNGDQIVDILDCVYVPPPPNIPPVALNDGAFTPLNTPVFIDILSNDSDADGVLVPPATMVSPPMPGASFSFSTGTYTPALNFSGIDTFVYQICDDDGACDTATVTIVVTAPPTAVDDAKATIVGAPVAVDVLANDSDPDNGLNQATVTIISGPANGSVSVNGTNGVVTYTPAGSFFGIDTFVYQVCDNTSVLYGGPLCDTATVTITVYAPPVAVDDTDSGTQGSPVNTIVLANDSDPDTALSLLTVSIVTPPLNGTAIVQPDGSITWTPSSAFFGAVSYTYQICDNTPSPLGPLCDSAVVTIGVLAPPIAQNDSFFTGQNDPVTLSLFGNDSDPDGTLGTNCLIITIPPQFGTLSVIDQATGTMIYTPNTGYSGIDQFTYSICDNDGLTDTAVVTIGIEANAPPIANDDSGITIVNVPITLAVLGNDSDPDGILDVGSLTILTGPAVGTGSVTISGGSIVYSPGAFTGSTTFVYEICDDDGACDSATVTVTVYGPPVANDDAASMPIGTSVLVAVLANDTDPESDINPSSVTIVTPPAHGTATIQLDGSILYTQTNLSFTGPTDTFVYQVCDLTPSPLAPQCDTATVTITLLLPPVALDDSATTPVGTPVAIPVLVNDTDPDGSIDPTSVTIMTPPPSGSVSVNPLTGVITFTPAPGFVGVITFAYQVCDTSGIPTFCDSALVTVTVTPVVIPPPVVPPAPLPPATPAVVLPTPPVLAGVPPVIGGNEFILSSANGLQPAPLFSNGVIQAIANEPQLILIEGENLVSLSLEITGSPTRTQSCRWSADVKLWACQALFPHAGEFTIVARGTGSNGEVVSRQINNALSIEAGLVVDASTKAPILDAYATLYSRDRDTGRFSKMQSESFGISNPFSLERGRLYVPVPPGEYYLEIASETRGPVRSQIATVPTHSYLTGNVELPDGQPSLFQKMLSRLSPNSGSSENFPLSVPTAPDFSLLTVGEIARDITVTSVDQPNPQSLFGVLRPTRKTLLYVGSTWNTLNAVELETFSTLGEKIDLGKINVVALTGLIPNEVAAQGSARGAYDIAFVTPAKNFFEDYHIMSYPTLILLDEDRRIIQTWQGIMTEEELVNWISENAF